MSDLDFKAICSTFVGYILLKIACLLHDGIAAANRITKVRAWRNRNVCTGFSHQNKAAMLAIFAISNYDRWKITSEPTRGNKGD